MTGSYVKFSSKGFAIRSDRAIIRRKTICGQEGVAMRNQLEAKLAEVKSDYVRIQGDMDKLEYVRGRVSAAEEQLIRLEKEIAELNKRLEELAE